MEDDKNAVVKYLLNGICNGADNFQYRFYQWGGITKSIDKVDNIKVEYSGKADCAGLEILESLIDKNDAILFISDGNIDREERNKLKDLSETIITIFIGVDANRNNLKKVSTNNSVYSVVDFMQALNDTQK